MQPWQIKSYEDYLGAYRKAAETPDAFWSGVAESFQWKKPFESVCKADFKSGEFTWFEGGELNITENCLDRHLAERGDHTALIFEPNDPQTKHSTFTYKELHKAVCKTANMLKKLGVAKGDRVCVYMPMVPELMFTLLACARIGAVHSVVFAGFSAESLASRIADCGCKIVVTADTALRGAKRVDLKGTVDTALERPECSAVETVLLLRHAHTDLKLHKTRDHVWSELLPEASHVCPPESCHSEDPLFVLYTSGSTGAPKGVVHTTAGYMVWAAYTFANVFQVGPESRHWCTADIGWITGHSYITYGPLLTGTTTVMFEGVPTWPHAGRFWEVVDKHRVTHFYTAPTAIRSLQAAGDEHVQKSNRSSLQVLGTVGEPINASAWQWYHDTVGEGRCPIVDTWWQTETGGIMIAPLAGITPTRPTYAGLPLPGVEPVMVNDDGVEIDTLNATGSLCLKKPWPGMLRGVYNNQERFLNAYLRPYPGKYFTGDGCKRDVDGYYRVTGRVDDVLNVSGHRIGTAEIENAINRNPHVVESAVVGVSDDIRGQAICAFVVTDGEVVKDSLPSLIKKEVGLHIGAIARPHLVIVASGLPKTRSGKIMRRILRKIAAGGKSDFGDTSTLVNPEIVPQLCKNYEDFLSLSTVNQGVG